MSSVGAILRRAREKQDRDMAQIAEGLCLTERYLRALEEDDIKSLPGIFFYRSFVKQYAAALGVPQQLLQPGIDLLTGVREEAALPGQMVASAAVRIRDPIVQSSNRDYLRERRIGLPAAVLGAAILISSVFYSWWSRPAGIQAQAPAKSQSSVFPPSPAPSVKAPAAADPASARPADPASAAPGKAVLALAAKDLTWLSITSDGKEIFSGVLQPGETKVLTASELTRVRIGNAGGVEIKWNGKPVGALGASGEVKTIQFTPDNFQVVAPTPKPAPEPTPESTPEPPVF
jgi:cytoskeletal protein RodZ